MVCILKEKSKPLFGFLNHAYSYTMKTIVFYYVFLAILFYRVKKSVISIHTKNLIRQGNVSH